MGILNLYDEGWAGGNGDGHLNFSEALLSGVLLKASKNVDQSNGSFLFNVLNGENALLAGTLNRAFVLQVGSEPQNANDTSSSLRRLQIEWVKLALKFDLTQRALDHFGVDGSVPQEQLRSVLTALGYTTLIVSPTLEKIVDSSLLGGNEDGRFDAIEVLAIILYSKFSDFRLACNPGDYKSLGKTMVSYIKELYPIVGRSWFDEGSVPTFTKAMGSFDEKHKGGNENGRLDAAELSVGLAYMNVLEQLFIRYDQNRNGQISRGEISSLFEEISSDPEMLKAFFADFALEDDHIGRWDKIRYALFVDKSIQELSPYDFYKRLEKVLPKYLSTTRTGSGASGSF